MGTCEIHGCQARAIARGHCGKHYQFVYRRDNLGTSRWNRPETILSMIPLGSRCVIRGCYRRGKTCGLCVIHMARIRKYGTPEPPASKRFSGEAAGYVKANNGLETVYDLDDEQFYPACLQCGNPENIYGYCLPCYTQVWSKVHGVAFPGGEEYGIYDGPVKVYGRRFYLVREGKNVVLATEELEGGNASRYTDAPDPKQLGTPNKADLTGDELTKARERAEAEAIAAEPDLLEAGEN